MGTSGTTHEDSTTTPSPTDHTTEHDNPPDNHKTPDSGHQMPDSGLGTRGGGRENRDGGREIPGGRDDIRRGAGEIGAPGHEMPEGDRDAARLGCGTPQSEPAPPTRAPAGRRRRVPLIEFLQPGSAVRRARSVLGAILGRAGVDEDRIRDAQLIVMELTANAERHARPPYELRVHDRRGVPAWCEVVDAAPDLDEIRALLARPAHLGEQPDLPLAELLAENGRGLLLAQRLSGGTCRAYPTRRTTTGAPAKALAFALPAAQARTAALPTVALPAAAVPAVALPAGPRQRLPAVER